MTALLTLRTIRATFVEVPMALPEHGLRAVKLRLGRVTAEQDLAVVCAARRGCLKPSR